MGELPWAYFLKFQSTLACPRVLGGLVAEGCRKATGSRCARGWADKDDVRRGSAAAAAGVAGPRVPPPMAG